MAAPKKIVLKKSGKTEKSEKSNKMSGSTLHNEDKYHYVPHPLQNAAPVKIVAPAIEPPSPPSPLPHIVPPTIAPPPQPASKQTTLLSPVENNIESTSAFEQKKLAVRGKPAPVCDDVDIFKEQLQNYLELTDTLNNPKWTFSSIIDTLYVLMESIDIDVIAVGMIDFAAGKKLCPIVSRGFRIPPDQTIAAIWEKAIVDGPAINWNNLMTIAASATSELSKWIAKEGLDSLGYVPIHDNKTIFGFLFIGNHGKKSPSPLASSILELCGGRLGIVIALRKLQGEWPVKV